MKKVFFTVLLCVSFGIFAQDSPGVYTIKNVKINTSHSDFGTAFLGDNKVVFAAPRDGFTLSREEYKGQPFLDLHVAEVSEDGKLIRKQKLPGDVNTKYHEGMVTFSKDMKTVYFSANGKIKRIKRKKNKDVGIKTKGSANIHLFKASIDENGDWGNLEMLPFNDESYSTGHPVLNRDDTKLYFVSDSPESLGKTDIFVVDLYEDGSYGQPVNLGPKINTPEREMFPFIGKDNVLYFSSDGFPGLGELDVYASKIFDNTVSDPINLGEPVNSVSDDFAYIIDDRKHKGYFSSNREGGKGDDDIYSFTASPPINIECQQEITGVVKDIDTQELIPNVTIILFDETGEKLQSFVSNEDAAAFSFMQSCNTNYKIQGFLEGYLVGEMDIQTVNDLDADPIEIVFNINMDSENDSNVIAATNSTAMEQAAADLDDETEAQKRVERDPVSTTTAENNTPAVIAAATANQKEANEVDSIDESIGLAESSSSSNDKKLVYSENIEPNDVASTVNDFKEGASEAKKAEKEIATNSKEVESSDLAVNYDPATGEVDGLKINTIYFDFDKDNIRYDAKIELDKLIKVMKEYPEMKIEVNAHTDIRGKKKYNDGLSNKRADATSKYLVDNGVDSKRISSYWFGELRPVEKCTKESPCTSFQHQLNRRSEFSIIDKSSDQIIVKSVNRKNNLSQKDNSYTSNSGLFMNYNFFEDREVYTVQIGAFKGKVQTNKYGKLTNLFNHRYDDGLDRYYSGIFQSPSEARNHMRLMRKNGYVGAFVVGLKGENRF